MPNDVERAIRRITTPAVDVQVLESRNLVAFLVESGAIQLSTDADADGRTLADDVADDITRMKARSALALRELLMSHDAIGEVFSDDDELAALLERFGW